MFSKWKSLLTATLAGSLGSLALSTGIAQADTIAPLPINGYYQLAVDSAHGHLFFSQGSSADDDIVVTNLSGQEVATIGGQNGVKGIALSPDGSTLYAALGSGDAVSAISTSTLAVTATYPLPAGDAPQEVAVQSGKVWVSYSGTGSSAAIGDIDLTAAAPAFETQAAMGGWTGAPELAADPQDSGVLVAGLPTSNGSVVSYNVAADPATVRSPDGISNCENEEDLAVVPGGADFILACGAPYNHYEYSTTDMSQQGVYPSTAYPGAVAIAANGTVAAGTVDGTGQPDLYVYQPGASSPQITYRFESANGDGGPYLATRGLAWSADGAQLYAVLQAGVAGGPYSLRVTDPPLSSSVLTVTGPSSVPVGDSVSVTGTLTLGTASVPSGTVVTVIRSQAGSGSTQQRTVQVAANGAFSLSDTPTAVGTYSYTVDYAGDSAVAPASASYSVSVHADTSTLSLTGPSTATIGKSVTLAGKLALQAHSSLPAGTTVAITRTGAGSTKSTSIKPAANGTFSLTDTPPSLGSYTYTAKYSGTSAINSGTATHALSVDKITPALSIATGALTFGYNATVHVTAHLGSTYTNRTVSIYAQPVGGVKKLLKSGRVSSTGTLTVSYVAPHSTTFSEVFTGDAKYAAKTITHAVTVSAKVSATQSGYYASKKVGSLTYRLYHRAAHLNVAVTVAPNKHGQCVKLEAQEYFGGAWHANVTTGCAALNSVSKASGYLLLNEADLNYHYRIRADYVRSGGDTSNLSSDSGWLYFMVEK